MSQLTISRNRKISADSLTSVYWDHIKEIKIKTRLCHNLNVVSNSIRKSFKKEKSQEQFSSISSQNKC